MPTAHSPQTMHCLPSKLIHYTGPTTMWFPPRCGSHHDALQPSSAFSRGDQTTQSIPKAKFPQQPIAKLVWNKSSRKGSYSRVVLRNQAWDKAQRGTQKNSLRQCTDQQHKPIKPWPLAGEVFHRGASVPSRQTPRRSCTAVLNSKDR